MLLRSSAAFLALAATLAIPSESQAQGRDALRLPMPAAPDMSQMTGRAQPGVAASSPVGFGPSKGDIFAGFGYQSATSAGSESDGTISAGMGFLDPTDMVGIELVLTSLSTVRSGFGSRMTAGLKVHKAFAGNVGVGLGIEGLKINGDNDTDPAIYVAATKVMPIRVGMSTFNQVTLNFGIGNGRFQPIEDFAAGESGMGVFAGGALKINHFSSFIVDYGGAGLNIAASFTPLQNLPLVITPSFSDVTGVAPNGKAGRFALGAGFSWKY
jgi:hypothetical protein